MRLLMVSLLVLIATVAAALFVLQDSGHVMIAYGNWTIESSLPLFAAGLLILFVMLYYSLRLWSGIRTLPLRLRRWRRQRRSAKSRVAYIRGMTALIEGEWAAAEKWLLKQVHLSDTPVLNYLAAAQAAEAQGSMVRRDSYLRSALEHDPKADVAVGLAQAGYYLEHQQAEEAHAVLNRLRVAHAPAHSAVLNKLLEASIALQEWEGLLELMPELERRDIIAKGKAEELQGMAYRALYTQAAYKKDGAYLSQLWERTPSPLRRKEDVLFDYARAIVTVELNAGAQLDSLLDDAINRRWSDGLVYAYGVIPSEKPAAQIANAERWLIHHADNAVLLLTLGRLCVRNQLWGKGRSYLEASLAIDPQAETYRELGTLLERLNKPDAALDSYRKALTLIPGKSFPSLSTQGKYPSAVYQDMPLLPAQMR